MSRHLIQLLEEIFIVISELYTNTSYASNFFLAWNLGNIKRSTDYIKIQTNSLVDLELSYLLLKKRLKKC